MPRWPCLVSNYDPTETKLEEFGKAQFLVGNGWQGLLDSFIQSPEGENLLRLLNGALGQHQIIFPPKPLQALALTALDDVKVVILGQDPYHGQGQANGLAFSVNPGMKVPPSLRNIFKELKQDSQLVKYQPPVNGCLVRWARQGVLLINSCMTVGLGKPNSHANFGWEALAYLILKKITERNRPVVFLLWGKNAQARGDLILGEALRCAKSTKNTLVMRASHPSPFSANKGMSSFIGCGHFGTTNLFLDGRGLTPIRW